MDVKQNEKKKKNLKNGMILKEEPSAGEYNGLCGNAFPNQSYETFMDIMFIAVFSSWLVEGLVMALTTVILKYIFIFHFSQLSLSLFVQNSFLVLFGGSASL